MRAFSRHVEKQILNMYFRATQCKAPEKIYLGLLLAPPGKVGTGREVDGKGYRRVVVSFGAPTDDSRIENSAESVFPMAEEIWGEVAHFGIYDAATGGNLIAPGKLEESVKVVKRMVVKFPPGSLVIEFAEVG
jgi:hypothetical protein